MLSTFISLAEEHKCYFELRVTTGTRVQNLRSIHFMQHLVSYAANYLINEIFHHSRCSLIHSLSLTRSLSLILSLSHSLSHSLSLSLSLSVRPDKNEDAKDAIKRDMMRHGIDFDFLNFETSSLRIFSLFSPI